MVSNGYGEMTGHVTVLGKGLTKTFIEVATSMNKLWDGRATLQMEIN